QGGVKTALAGKTGKQILRMRYAHDDTGERTAPIIGRILPSDSGNGSMMSVNLDMYVDAPFVLAWGGNIPNNSSNARSLEISMDLEGSINFLEDGRMMVEQVNTHPVNI